jgi:hypothetical protein
LIGLVGLLLTFVSVASYLFVSAGVVMSGYDRLLGEGEYTQSARKEEEHHDKIGGIYWPLVVAVYLLWSFLSGSWAISWVIWPVAGLVFAALTATVSALKKK